MAILLIEEGKNTSSDAKVGDIVVTGGGIWEKTSSGSVRRTDLEASTGYSGKVGNYNTLATEVFGKVKSSLEKTGYSPVTNRDTTPAPVKTTDPAPGTTTDAPDSSDNYDVNYDLNGIGYISGFDPGMYATSTASGGSGTEGAKTILGYVVLALIGLVILDRFIGGK